MESLMRKEAKTVVDDHKNGTALYDGTIYIMHTLDGDGVIVPRYIGKLETVGKTPGILSANLSRLDSDTSKFGRWGGNYAYHIGDLSLTDHKGSPLLRSRGLWLKGRQRQRFFYVGSIIAGSLCFIWAHPCPPQMSLGNGYGNHALSIRTFQKRCSSSLGVPPVRPALVPH